MLAWSTATATMEDFEALYDPYSIHTRPMEGLATRFFWGGTVLVLISGMSQWIARAGAASLIDYQRPSLGGILLNVLGQLGDLVESGMKRSAGVKDSASFIPGHGGILDRGDSLLFAGPVLYYYYIFLIVD